MKSLKKMTPAQVLILIKQIGKYGRFDIKIKINFYNNVLKIVDNELTVFLIFMIENLSSRVWRPTKQCSNDNFKASKSSNDARMAWLLCCFKKNCTVLWATLETGRFGQGIPLPMFVPSEQGLIIFITIFKWKVC